MLDLPEPFVKLTQVGAHGVDIFIVLSGFVLMLAFTRPGRAVDVRGFYGRRMWRILPAYWVALAFATLFAATPLWRLTVGGQATPWDVLVHALGLQTIFTPTLSSINGSLWSVSLELCLYLLFPLLVVLLHRFGGITLMLAAIALCGVLGATGAAIGGPFGSFPSDPFSLPMRLVQFVAGMVLATIVARLDVSRIRESRRGRLLAWAGALAAGVIATLASTLEAPFVVTHSLWALSGASLVWLFAVLPASRPLTLLDAAGQRAYSFYLLHQPIVLLLIPLVVVLPAPGLVVLAVVGTLGLIITGLAAELLFRFVERPSHRAAQHRFPRVYRDNAASRNT